MYLIYIVFISLVFNQSYKAEIIELDIGANHPTGAFEKYAEPGFSARFAYSKSFNSNGLFKWQVGMQYIQFENNWYEDSFLMSSGKYGPSVEVNNSEQAYIFNGGVRLSATNGILNKGNFRPYIGASVGFAFFNETTTWHWDSNNSTNCNSSDFWIWMVGEVFDLCDDDDNMHDVLHRNTEPVFSLDIGTNLFFSDKHQIGVDLGIRYNMVTGLKRPENIYELSTENDGIFQNTHASLANKLQADYYTWYIGVSIKLDSNKRAQKKEEKRRRRQGKLI